MKSLHPSAHLRRTLGRLSACTRRCARRWPHAAIPGGAAKLDLRVLFLGNPLGHAVVPRRPRALSHQNAGIAACKVILASLMRQPARGENRHPGSQLSLCSVW